MKVKERLPEVCKQKSWGGKDKKGLNMIKEHYMYRKYYKETPSYVKKDKLSMVKHMPVLQRQRQVDQKFKVMLATQFKTSLGRSCLNYLTN